VKVSVFGRKFYYSPQFAETRPLLVNAKLSPHPVSLAYFVQKMIIEPVVPEIAKMFEGFRPRRGKYKRHPKAGAQIEQKRINIMKSFIKAAEAKAREAKN
jgi:hypothetical protein